MKNVVKAMAVTLMLCLCGCGAGQPGPHPLSDSLQQSSAVEKDERALPQGMGGLESGDGALSGETGPGDGAAHESMAAHGETAPAAGAFPGDTVRDRIPVNTTEETVETEWDGIRISRVFGSSGNTMYFCQWAREGREAALYEMEAGAFALQKVDMDIPEGMDIYGISSDASGCLYLLMRTKVSGTEQVRSVIRVLDQEGITIKELDISDAIEGKIPIHQAFVTDGEGNFYIRGLSSSAYIGGDGTMLWEAYDEALGISGCNSAVCGADGQIYLAYNRDGGLYVGTVETEDGSIREEFPLDAMNGDDVLFTVGQGTDSGLLLYASSGIWAWNREGNSLERRSSMSEASLPYSETVVIRAFLEDGRLFLAVNRSDGDELTGRSYKYFPAGR